MTLKSLTHKMTAYFQAVLSVVFIVEYFLVLRLFLDGHVKVPGEYHDMMIALIGVLTGSVMTITAFWFNRQRTSVSGADDPQSPEFQQLIRWLAAHHLPLPAGVQAQPAGNQTQTSQVTP